MEGGARFLSGGDDGMVRLWDAETGQMQLVVGAGRGGAVWSIRHCPTRGHLLSAATNGTLVQTDLRSGRMVCQQVSAHDDAVAGIQLDEQKVVTSGFDSAVKIWDLRMGLAQRARLDAPHGTRCTRLAYDENRIVTGSLCGAIVVWDFQ
jgi:WD40 repeat protein